MFQYSGKVEPRLLAEVLEIMLLGNVCVEKFRLDLTKNYTQLIPVLVVVGVFVYFQGRNPNIFRLPGRDKSQKILYCLYG